MSVEEDRGIIQRILEEEEEGWVQGDAERILVGYAADAAIYEAHLSSDPREWTFGWRYETFRRRVEEMLEDSEIEREDQPVGEIESLDIEGDRSTAVKRTPWRMTEEQGMSLSPFVRAMYFLSRTDGSWKIMQVIRGLPHRSPIPRAKRIFAEQLNRRGVKWTYRPGAFQLRGTVFQPDFYVESENTYYTVIGTVSAYRTSEHKIRRMQREHPSVQLHLVRPDGSTFEPPEDRRDTVPVAARIEESVDDVLQELCEEGRRKPEVIQSVLAYFADLPPEDRARIVADK